MNEVNYTDLNSEIKFSLLSTSYISISNVIGMTKHLILIQMAFTFSLHPESWGLRSFITGNRRNIWQGFFPQSLIMTEIAHPSKPQLLQNWMLTLIIAFHITRHILTEIFQTYKKECFWWWNMDSSKFPFLSFKSDLKAVDRRWYTAAKNRGYSASDKRQTMPIVVIITTFTLLPNLIM